jgi:phage major head subunit gpT-like protein
MEITNANLDKIREALNIQWQAGVEHGSKIDISFLFDVRESTTKAEAYAWLERIPGFREWLGDRVFHDVVSRLHELTNRDWEDSVKVGINDIEDDQIGLFSDIVRWMGSGWEELKYELIVDTILNNDQTFDGVAVFSDSHVKGYHSALDNLTTDTFSAAAYEAAFLAASTWRWEDDNRENGRPCRTTFTHLLHGEKIADTVFDVVGARQVSDGAGGNLDNRHYQEVTPVKIPEFTGDYENFWMLADCSDIVKPFVLQLRKDAHPMMTNDATYVMEHKAAVYHADGRAAATPSFPHLLYGGRTPAS